MKKLFIILLAGLIGTFAFAETKIMEVGTISLAPIKFTHNESNWSIFVSDITQVSEEKVKVTYGFKKDTKQVSYTFTIGNEYELGHETNIFVNVGTYKLVSFDDNELIFEVVKKDEMTFK